MKAGDIVKEGLAQLKQEDRCVLYNGPEDLNILSHVVCNLKNRIADKNEKKGITALNRTISDWGK